MKTHFTLCETAFLPTPPAVCQEVGGSGGGSPRLLLGLLYTQTDNSQKTFLSWPRIPLPNRQLAHASSELPLRLAVVSSPCCSFIFLTPHELKSLYFNSFRACLDPRTGWRVLVRINHTFWQATVSLTHIGAGIQPCKTAQPIYYSLIIRPN